MYQSLWTVLYICMVLQVYRGSYKHDCGVLFLIFHFACILILYLMHQSCSFNITPKNVMDHLAISSVFFTLKIIIMITESNIISHWRWNWNQKCIFKKRHFKHINNYWLNKHHKTFVTLSSEVFYPPIWPQPFTDQLGSLWLLLDNKSVLLVTSSGHWGMTQDLSCGMSVDFHFPSWIQARKWQPKQSKHTGWQRRQQRHNLWDQYPQIPSCQCTRYLPIRLLYPIPMHNLTSRKATLSFLTYKPILMQMNSICFFKKATCESVRLGSFINLLITWKRKTAIYIMQVLVLPLTLL